MTESICLATIGGLAGSYGIPAATGFVTPRRPIAPPAALDLRLLGSVFLLTLVQGTRWPVAVVGTPVTP
jgi:hypothetical protein